MFFGESQSSLRFVRSAQVAGAVRSAEPEEGVQHVGRPPREAGGAGHRGGGARGSRMSCPRLQYFPDVFCSAARTF